MATISESQIEPRVNSYDESSNTMKRKYPFIPDDLEATLKQQTEHTKPDRVCFIKYHCSSARFYGMKTL